MLALPTNLANAINAQMNLERLNEAYYDALAVQMQFVNLDGASRFFEASAREEHSHYARMRDYLIDRNVLPALGAVSAPTINATTLATGVKAAQERERITTQAIDDLYDLAEESGDNQTCQFLLWFVEEQTRSERELLDLAAKISRVGSGLGEQWLDSELGAKAN